jgi:putative PIN family toxin of toxin-antitoxin system
VPRAIFDANVLVSAALNHLGYSARILELAVGGKCELILPDEVLIEVRRTFFEPYFVERIGTHNIDAFLDDLMAASIRDSGIRPPLANVATHPEDDVIISAALRAGVDYLVTGDKHLRSIDSYQSIVILTPREFHMIIS